MWERTLQDLIRGLRSHKNSSKAELDAFIEEALEEIRGELRGKDMDLKAEGVVKMCYLMMLYPLPPPPSFAFHVVEVMSSPRYHLKQLGYIAAPMAFSSETEEVVLTVNGMRKDLLSPHPSLPPLALSGLSDIITPSLAREVNHDVLSLLTHSKPQVRKRAVLAMFKVFEKNPESLRTGFGRLKDRLEDDDPSVVSATINVITELSRKSNPKNYLPLAPQLFEILTTSSNNWMLIKVVKLFATLTPLEPRLTRKLLPPLTNLISTTPAISLLYECVRTCIVGGMLDAGVVGGTELAGVCVEKLGRFLGDEDQNLKYIALLAMVKIVPSHPDLVVDYQEEILKSLDDADVSIRMRALELVSAMVNRRNIREIVTQLLSHLVPPTTASTLPSAIASLTKSTSGTDSPISPATPPHMSPHYRLEIVRRILAITSHDTYTHITDFEWYLSVLIDLTYVSAVDVGAEIRDRILDVVGRVKGVRGYAVGVLARLVDDVNWLEGLGSGGGGCGEVLFAAAWVCGEYSSHLYDAKSTITSLFNPSILHLDPPTIAVCVSAATKMFGYWAVQASEKWSRDLWEDAKTLVATIVAGLERFMATGELEVQERASNSLQLFRFIQADLTSHIPPNQPSSNVPDMPNGFEADSQDPNYPKSLFLLQPLFTGYELNPVGYKAQESVKVPEGLDLDAPLVSFMDWSAADVEEFPDVEDEDEAMDLGEGGGKGMEELRRVLREDGKKVKGKGKAKRVGTGPGGKETKEERAARKAKKAARQQDPYYLQDKRNGADSDDEDIDAIPIVKLELDLPDEPSSPLQSTKKTGKRRKAREPTPPPPDIDRTGEMPEGSEAAAAPAKSKTDVSIKPHEDEEGLKGIDLYDQSSTGAGSQVAPSRSRYEEYREDEDDAPAVAAPVVPEERAPEPTKVEVVRVKKKKKKGVALDA